MTSQQALSSRCAKSPAFLKPFNLSFHSVPFKGPARPARMAFRRSWNQRSCQGLHIPVYAPPLTHAECFGHHEASSV